MSSKEIYIEQISYLQSATKYIKGGHSYTTDNDQFSKQKQKICDFIQNNNSGQVPEKQLESFLCWPTEILAINCCHYVGISIEKFHKLLKAVETAFAKAKHALK